VLGGDALELRPEPVRPHPVEPLAVAALELRAADVPAEQPERLEVAGLMLELVGRSPPRPADRGRHGDPVLAPVAAVAADREPSRHRGSTAEGSAPAESARAWRLASLKSRRPGGLADQVALQGGRRPALLDRPGAQASRALVCGGVSRCVTPEGVAQAQPAFSLALLLLLLELPPALVDVRTMAASTSAMRSFDVIASSSTAALFPHRAACGSVFFGRRPLVALRGRDGEALDVDRHARRVRGKLSLGRHG
jgi:hypothetical protein